MKKIVKLSLATAMLMGMGTVSAQAADNGLSIMDGVYLKGEIRPRYEFVDASDNGKNDANAFTNRLTLGAGSDKLFGSDMLGAYLEMTDVHNFNDRYNSTDNGETNYQTVVDPEQTRVTQSYIEVKAAGAKLRYGRQTINLDNQRFIGSVNWRQMPQTFDATTLTYSGIKNLNLFASYSTQRNGVKDSDDRTTTYGTRDLFLNASYNFKDNCI